MRFPPNLLDLLIKHDAFRVCRIMPQGDFIRYCADRNVKVDAKRLRQFEQIGVFRPLLRVFRPEIVYKTHPVGDNRFRYGKPLKDGEIWDGETRTEYPEFGSTSRAAKEWKKEGLLWVPGQGAWGHEATIDSHADQHEAYYSQFQLHPLMRVNSGLTMTVQLEWAVLPDGSRNPKFSPRLRHRAALAAEGIASALRGPRQDDIIAVLLQFLANRYFYKTQGDGRLTTYGHFHDWDWREYVRAWKPKSILSAFEIAETDSRRHYESLDIAWTHADPVARWYNLARFVRVEKRKRLKGDALKGAALREMAQMLGLFHREAFGTDIPPLGEVGVQVFKRIPDIDPAVDPMRALELSANDFGVNSKPQLVLFVEGQTEETIIPVIFERIWGAPPSRFGIEISSLGGVDNAAGGKEAPFSALWRLVDYLHHHQTLAFILLDNEGYAARNVGKGLPKASSVHSGDRMATRSDHVKIWDTTFEFDNFSDTELALAMNELAGEKAFKRSEVAACRAAVRAGPKKGAKLLTIDLLYELRLKRPLDKPQLGLILTEILLDPNARRKPDSRPIIKFLIHTANKASRNHQPVTQSGWEANQRSGYVGTLLPHAQKDLRRQANSRQKKRLRATKKAAKQP